MRDSDDNRQSTIDNRQSTIDNRQSTAEAEKSSVNKSVSTDLTGEKQSDSNPLNQILFIDSENNDQTIALTNRRTFLKTASMVTGGSLLTTALTPLKASAAFIGFWKKKVALQTGTLWAWGGNSVGQLGDGTVTTRSPVTKIGTATNWYSVASYVHTAAVRSDGSLWTWGTATNGILGDGQSATPRSSPLQIGALTNWKKVVMSYYFALALKTDSSLWAWGVSGNYQLGDGTIIAKSSPIQVGSSTDWVKIAAGTSSSMALK